jgi:amidohydrolase
MASSIWKKERRNPDGMDIKADVDKLKNELIELRRDFHRHPELGLEEHRTADKIESYLKPLGCGLSRIGKTGVVGLLKGSQPGRTLMLRADMDALPVQEMTAVSYKSVHEGKMHACGHDGHMAMLLVAAKILCEHRDRLKGNIKFLFQPNEENMHAGLLIEKGVLENPTVDAAFGTHLMTPLETGKIGVASGAVMAGMHTFKLVIKGKGGHTGFPQESIDPIITATNVVQTTQIIQSREIDAFKPTVIVFGRIEGGAASNVIPEQVELEGTIRYLYDADAEGENHPCKKFERIVRHVCETHRASYDIKYPYSHPAVINDPDMTHFANQAAAEVTDTKDSIVPYVTMVGEDFCEFANRVPAAFYFIGAGNSDKAADYPHHHACFNIDEDALPIGVEMHVRTALAFLRP